MRTVNDILNQTGQKNSLLCNSPVLEENPGRLKLYCFTSSYQRSATSFPEWAQDNNNPSQQDYQISPIVCDRNVKTQHHRVTNPFRTHVAYSAMVFATQCCTVWDALWITPSCSDIFLEWVMVTEISNTVWSGVEIDPSCSLTERKPHRLSMDGSTVAGI